MNNLKRFSVFALTKCNFSILIFIAILISSFSFITCSADSDSDTGSDTLFTNADAFFSSINSNNGNFTVKILENDTSNIHEDCDFKVAGDISYAYIKEYNTDVLSGWWEQYYKFNGTSADVKARNGNTIAGEKTGMFNTSTSSNAKYVFYDWDFGEFLLSLSGNDFNKNGNVYSLKNTISTINGNITDCNITINSTQVGINMKVDYNSNIRDMSYTFTAFGSTNISLDVSGLGWLNAYI